MTSDRDSAHPSADTIHSAGWEPSPQPNRAAGADKAAERKALRKTNRIDGEVRNFNTLGGENGPMLWKFTLERYQDGERLPQVAVQAGYVRNGVLNDGNLVTVHGKFDRNGLFRAVSIINHSLGTSIRVKGAAFYLLVFFGVFIVISIAFFSFALGMT